MGNPIGDLSWTFYSECEVPSDITESFIDG